MDERHAKQLLMEMLARFTAGSLLHLLAEVLRDEAAGQPAVAEQLRDAVGTLFTVGLGLDAVLPGAGHDNGPLPEERE